MVIRRLRETEWNAWRDVRLRSLADSPAAFGSSLDRESAYPDTEWVERTRLLARGEDRVMFVADGGGAPVACGGAFLEGDAAAVIAMWTAPAHRGTGLGARILDAVEGWAREVGAARLVLYVVKGNRAESLYERAGFRRTGVEEPLDRDPALMLVQMARAIGGEA